MRPKLIVTFMLIVLAPMVLLLGFGYRMAQNEKKVVEQGFLDLLNDSLRDMDGNIAAFVQERERYLLEMQVPEAPETAALRDLVRKDRYIRQLFIMSPGGDRLHPPPGQPLSDAEEAFLERTDDIWTGKHRFFTTPDQPVPQDTYDTTSRSPLKRSQIKSNTASPNGWHIRYWQDGINLIFWRLEGTGNVIGLELDRMQFLSDLIGKLPDTQQPSKRTRTLFRLRNAAGEVVYQWGNYDPPDSAPANADLLLSPPLNAWQLEYFVPPQFADASQGGGMLLNFLAALGAVGLGVGWLAFYFYRESSREMREASQRVSFVNQVSHELKTPLTNIRMYAELLEAEVEEENTKAQRHISVVVSESRRLSRLIQNVLTFARSTEKRLTLNSSPGVIDEQIAEVIEQFRPALEEKHIEVRLHADAPAPVRFDRDLCGQILGNLIGNVEKYASGGGRLQINSLQETKNGSITTIIEILDRGPGIAAEERGKIFQPFYRISSKLSDGATGTGIGLAIARDLARRHGGDLVLLPETDGAAFRLTLETPPAQGEIT